MDSEFPSKLSEELLKKNFTEKEIEKAFKEAQEIEDNNQQYRLEDIVFYGETVAQSRPQFKVYPGQRFGHAYDNPKAKNFKVGFREFIRERVFEMVKDHTAYFPAAGQFTINIRVFRAMPKSWSKKKMILGESGIIRPETKPDFDNLAKSICDSMTKLLYMDDGQIVSCTVDKYYSSVPRAEIDIQFRIKGLCK